MSKRRHLIIGCGAAALSALKQIRKLGSKDEIKLVTMEKHLPYSPMSLPYLISGKRTEEDITIVDDDFFHKVDATLARGKRVDKIDPDQKRVFYVEGGNESYDTLLIATGSEPRLQPILVAAGVPGFHILDDYARLKDLKDESRIAILGAGFVGMELAVSFAEKGHEVTVIAPRERILRLYFDDEVDDIIIDLFAEHGIGVERQWGEVTEVDKHNDSFDVTFANDKKTTTEVLIAATGVSPRISFLNGSGLNTNEGILVDRKMKTNAPDIFAAGDVAEAPDFFTGKNGLSLIWPSAIEQGEIAGSNMVGEAVEYEGWLSMNAFNFFGHFAVSIGEFVGTEGDHSLVQKDTKKRCFGKIVCRDDKLIGANFFNMAVDGGVIQSLIKNRVDIGPHKELLLEKPKEAGLWLMQEAEQKSARSLDG